MKAQSIPAYWLGVTAVLVFSVYGHGHSEPLGGPLFLTPYLDEGRVDLARNRSIVRFQQPSKVPFSYSGYLTVDRTLSNHFFFWFFPSPTNASAPVLLWLNGGPAVSSMVGLFWEHGPMEVNKLRYNVSFGTRNHTWVGPFSVVYVDNPVGTGYSFSEQGRKGYKLNKDGYAGDLFNFVDQFFALFPDYKNLDFYIGGQSYAGKYVPPLAYRIFQQRKGINLQGILLGGPYFDPETQSVAFFDYLYAVGAITHHDMNKHKNRVREMYEEFLQTGNADKTFTELFEQLVLLSTLSLPSMDNYVSGKDVDYALIEVIMNRKDMRAAIHVGNQPYNVSNNDLAQCYGPDVMVSTKKDLASLMNVMKVLIYNGDYDVVVSSVMIEAALMSTHWKGQSVYNEATRNFWRDDSRLMGFYSQTGNLCRVVIHGAGHQTPHDVPDATLEMVTDFLQYGCVVPKNG